MKSFASLIVVVLVGLMIRESTPCEQLNDTTTCFNAISTLSAYDKALGTRSAVKTAIAQNVSSANVFKTEVQKAKATGTAFKCGETMSWVTEVFEGLESQYVEHKNAKYGKAAGYNSYVGEDLRKFFLAQKSVESRVVYHCQHTGTVDHVFSIEQIPASLNGNERSYRIYQSYNGAYSLKAWLSSDTSPEMSAKSGEIIIPHLTRCVNDVNDTSGECVQMRAMFQQFADQGAKGGLFADFANFIKNFNISKATEIFAKSWSKYGKSRLLSECEFFNDYLLKTRAVTEYYNEYSRSDTPFCPTIYEYWGDLYGSPDPMRYPGLPANITSLLFNKVDYPSGYGLEIKAVPLPAKDAMLNAQCAGNANVMLKSLESVIHGTA